LGVVDEIGLDKLDLDKPRQASTSSALESSAWQLGLDSFGLKTKCRALPELTPEAGTPDVYQVNY